MSYKLFLDDIRAPPSEDWVLARSFTEACIILKTKGFPWLVSFDHDLGEENSGYDFAHVLIEEDLNNQTMPEDFDYDVHSQNPVGKKNIDALLGNYLMFKKEDC